MKATEIKKDTTYNNGGVRSGTRTVMLIGTYVECGGYSHHAPIDDRWVCYRDNRTGRESAMTIRSFARWARKEMREA